MLADDNFTKNGPLGIFQNVLNNVHSCFCWRIYQLLLKLMSWQEKLQAVWFFEETKRVNSFLAQCSQKNHKNE